MTKLYISTFVLVLINFVNFNTAHRQYINDLPNSQIISQNFPAAGHTNPTGGGGALCQFGRDFAAQ
eukprot:Pgem_evm1s15894